MMIVNHRANPTRSPLLHLSCLTVGLLLLILCSTSLVAAEDVDVLTIADSTGDWGYPSPYGHYSRGPGYIRMSLIFDTLVWKDEGGVVPALAEKWEYLERENAYVFDLRDGVMWNDGEPFTAEDVAFTFEYMGDHPYATTDTSMVGEVEAFDDGSIKITLNRPYAPFLSVVAGAIPILPQHVYEGVDDPEGFQEPGALTGTGPFKLVDYDRAQGTYLYEAYDGYYGGSPRVKQIRFVKVNEQMAGAALKKGDADAATVKGDMVEGLEDEDFNVIEGSHDWAAKLMINHKEEPFSDVRFRQALAYAIDREALVDTALRGYGLAGSPGLYASDNDWYNPDQEQYAYDPARAGALLEEMGYTKDGDYYSRDGTPLTVELLMSPINDNERAGQMVAAQLEEAGIRVDARSMNQKTLDSLINEWNFDLAVSGHGGLGADPEMLNRMILGKSFNSARYDGNKDLKGVLEDQVAEMDPDGRKELVDRAQEIYAQDVPALALYYTDSFWAFNDKVDFYFTRGGVGSGAPIAINKMAFV